MSFTDLHVHTTFSDGIHTPEEMVLAAIEKGMQCIGFSDHSYTFFDESYCMPKEKKPQYRQTIQELKTRYKDKIRVLCGVEQDFYSLMPTKGYDYVIGSVHYLKLGKQYIPVDETPQILLDAAKTYFGGDMYALAAAYYETVALVAEKIGADIIGHFDLICKFNQDGSLLDENDPRYVAAYQKAVDRLVLSGKPFERNTGAVARGLRPQPYPSDEICRYIRSRGGSFVLTSDSHSAQTLCYGFGQFAD